MRKTKLWAALLVTACFSSSGALAATSAQLEEDCEPLLSAVNDSLAARVKKAAIESSTLTGGGDLSATACISDIMDVDVDFFSNVSDWSSLFSNIFSSLEEDFVNSLNSMVCDVSEGLKSSADTFLSCSATLAISLEAAGGIDVPDLESCLGAGDKFGIDFSAAQAMGNGSSKVSTGGKYTVGSQSSPASTESTKSFLNSIKDKVTSLNDLKGN